MTNKASNDLKISYQIIKWKESQIIENCKIILQGATNIIHQITLATEERVYLVPERVYEFATKMMKQETMKRNNPSFNNKSKGEGL